MAVAVLIQIACGYYWYQRTPGYESWTGLMPDWALMSLVRKFPDDNLLVSRSLASRWGRGELSRSHMAELCERFLASPEALGITPPQTRPKWPIGLPVVIRMAKGPGGAMWFRFAGVDGQEFWREGADPELSPPLASSRGGVGWTDDRGYNLRLPAAQAGENTYSVLVERTFYDRWGSIGSAGVVWSQRFAPTTSFQGVATVDECITPIDTPEARRIVRDVCRLTAVPSGDDPRTPRLLTITVNPDAVDVPGRDYSLACRVTLEIDGQVILELRHDTYNTDQWYRTERWEIDLDAVPALAGRVNHDDWSLDLSGVSIRIRGDGELAIQDIYYDKYWSGEVVFDADELLKSSAR